MKEDNALVIVDPKDSEDYISESDRIQDQLNGLDVAIDEALQKLPIRQRKFAMLIAGGETQEKAALECGYSPKTARGQATRICSNVGMPEAIKLLEEKYRLTHGRSMDWKRRSLERIMERAHLEPNHARSAAAADKVMRTILELDGDIRQNSGGGSPNINISINTGIQDPSVIIDGEVKKDE